MDAWYLLPRSGRPYYGPVPDGVEMLDGPPAVEPSALPDPPTKSANKGAWVDHAVARGWAPEDAERKTKQELVDELGQQDVDAVEGSTPVGSEVPGVELAADAFEVGTVEGDGPGEDPGDDLGHGDEA